MSTQEQLEALQDIRQMMNKSVRFLSLSGLSGVFAGIYACITGIIAYKRLGDRFGYRHLNESEVYFFLALGIGTITLTLLTSYIFSSRKAKQQGLKMWDETAKTALINLSIPLVAGGLFCLILMYHQLFGLVAPTTLLFYGLALINVSKHTFPQVRHLGILQLVLGLLNAIYIGYGLLFWIIGFGLLHIIYGIFMHFKYDRK